MAEKSSFFTSLNGDRRYKANDFAEYFAKFIGNGVFPNPASNLQVVSNGDMTLTLYPGFAWINGYMYANTDDLTLTVEHSDAALKRIDRVVIRCDFIGREIRAYIKKGIFASAPIEPTLERGANAYEISVADIFVDNGVVSIAQSKITDTRLNTEICGIVTGIIKQIDTTTLYKQLEHDIKEKGLDMQTWLEAAKSHFSSWISETETSFADWLKDSKTGFEDEFNTWFDTIRNILDENTAGNLLNMINENRDLIETNTSVANDAKDLAEQALQAGVNAKENMVQAINSKKTVPDVKNEDSWEILTQRVNDIKEGSGNAQKADVLAGKTFTNSDGIEYTGTMPNRGGAVTITPGTTNQVKSAGYYSGDITIKGDTNLKGSNILKGKSIFGVMGTAPNIKIAKGVKYISSKYTPNTVTVNGLAFRPNLVVCKAIDPQNSTKNSIVDIFIDASTLYPNRDYNIINYYGWNYGTSDPVKCEFYNDGFKMQASSTYTTQTDYTWFAFYISEK